MQPAESFPKLILISVDGFGWKFMSKFAKHDLPHFHDFIENGVQVQWIENVFPTVTRTNHMSMVSGLYAENHGIVGNTFYDPSLDGIIPRAGGLSENGSKWVDVGAEPVWVTNSKAGGGRRSGCILWPCADAKIKGMLPEKLIKGEWTVSLEDLTHQQRIDKALEWMTDPEEAVNFVAVYFNQPDDVSHECGPDSQEVRDAIVDCDKAVGYLMEQIKKKRLDGRVNVIITADHGQISVNPAAQINIDELVDPAWYTPQPGLGVSQPMVNIWPKPGCYEKLLAGLKHRNLHVATKESSDLKEMHYSACNRIAPIVIYGEEGWLIANERSLCEKGSHGWDPRHSIDMYPFFLATGPAFKKGLRDAAPFHMVDIYPLMCHVLHLRPAPNDGSLNNAQHILAV